MLHPGHEIDMAEPDATLQCPVCYKVYTTKRGLQRHLREYHEVTEASAILEPDVVDVICHLHEAVRINDCADLPQLDRLQALQQPLTSMEDPKVTLRFRALKKRIEDPGKAQPIPWLWTVSQRASPEVWHKLDKLSYHSIQTCLRPQNLDRQPLAKALQKVHHSHLLELFRESLPSELCDRMSSLADDFGRWL
eukprot:s1435_g21.t1